MNFPALCIALTAVVLPACSHLGLGAELLSTPLEVRRTEGGFEATVRAGLDRWNVTNGTDDIIAAVIRDRQKDLEETWGSDVKS